MAYTHLTDDVIHRILRRKDSDLVEAKEILNNILTRKIYTYVDEVKEITEKEVKFTRPDSINKLDTDLHIHRDKYISNSLDMHIYWIDD